jgi:hypothetical protein
MEGMVGHILMVAVSMQFSIRAAEMQPGCHALLPQKEN